MFGLFPLNRLCIVRPTSLPLYVPHSSLLLPPTLRIVYSIFYFPCPCLCISLTPYMPSCPHPVCAAFTLYSRPSPCTALTLYALPSTTHHPSSWSSRPPTMAGRHMYGVRNCWSSRYLQHRSCRYTRQNSTQYRYTCKNSRMIIIR